MRSQSGQSTVEWVGTLGVVGALMLGLVAMGVRVPGSELARGVAERVLCAASIGGGCGDEVGLVAAYGAEVGELVRERMPMLVFEEGSRALPVDFRSCRDSSCGDGPERGLVHRSDAGLPVTAFVHVVDCRAGEAEGSEAGGADCSGSRAGNLYIGYFTYYADSATLRGIPVAGDEGYHHDDWEMVEVRIGADGEVDERASSHNGYNYELGVGNWGSDAGIGFIRDAAEELGARARNGWGPATGVLFVSGGSHAGNARGGPEADRYTPGRRVHLIPLEPIVATEDVTFAVSPPWRKRVWRDPEAAGTD